MAELNKYKDKPKQVKIDGERVFVGSAEWEAYSCKWRYFQFLEARAKDPSLVNPLDQIDWDDYWPEVYKILRRWMYVGMPNDWYSIAARDYQTHLENGGKQYKNQLHGYGTYDAKSKKLNIDPLSVKG